MKHVFSFTVAISTAVMVLVASSTSFGAITRIRDAATYATLQAVFDAGDHQNGDNIEVDDVGPYDAAFFNFHINNVTDVTLRSTMPGGVKTVVNRPAGDLFIVDDGDGMALTVQGFDIRGTNPTEGNSLGVTFNNPGKSVVFEDCDFTWQFNGIAMGIATKTDLTFRRCTFTKELSPDSVVRGNAYLEFWGDGLHEHVIVFEDCFFDGGGRSEASFKGFASAANAGLGPELTLRRCTFTNGYGLRAFVNWNGMPWKITVEDTQFQALTLFNDQGTWSGTQFDISGSTIPCLDLGPRMSGDTHNLIDDCTITTVLGDAIQYPDAPFGGGSLTLTNSRVDAGGKAFWWSCWNSPAPVDLYIGNSQLEGDSYPALTFFGKLASDTILNVSDTTVTSNGGTALGANMNGGLLDVQRSTFIAANPTLGHALEVQNLSTSATAQHTIANSVFVASASSGSWGMSLFGAGAIDIVHNTIYNDGVDQTGIGFRFDGSAACGPVNFNNNLIAGFDTGVYYFSQGLTGTNSFDSNLYGDVNTVFGSLGNSLADDGATVTDNSTDTITNISFVNASGLDFSLSASSTALDGGLITYDGTLDRSGFLRTDGAPDFGAYEYPLSEVSDWQQY